MDFVAEVRVMLKPLVNDPPGLVIRDGLRSLGFHEVQGVRSGKFLRIEVTADNRVDAQRRVEQMCQKLLANPVIEDFSFEIREAVAGA
jgi:phosphoribosylformylglycinamidine synthase PurS subunit